jgi:hypothetical protein
MSDVPSNEQLHANTEVLRIHLNQLEKRLGGQFEELSKVLNVIEDKFNGVENALGVLKEDDMKMIVQLSGLKDALTWRFAWLFASAAAVFVYIMDLKIESLVQ